MVFALYHGFQSTAECGVVSAGQAENEPESNKPEFLHLEFNMTLNKKVANSASPFHPPAVAHVKLDVGRNNNLAVHPNNSARTSVQSPNALADHMIEMLFTV